MRKLMGGVVLALLAGCASPEQQAVDAASDRARQEAALQPYFDQHGREPVMQCGYASARAGGTEDQKMSRFMGCVAQLPTVSSRVSVAAPQVQASAASADADSSWPALYAAPTTLITASDKAIDRQCRNEAQQVYIQASAVYSTASYVPDIRAISFMRDCLLSRFQAANRTGR